MSSLLTLSIGIGLTISLVFSELLGLAAGGMVVPGYIALYLNRPLDVVLTVGTGIVTFLLVHTFSTLAIVYGNRRTVLMILVGFLLGIGIESIPMATLDSLSLFVTKDSSDLSVIGYVIPGLIGIWIDRQGLLETLSVLSIASVLVRLVLVLLGMEPAV